jgi:hypothetical protein
MYLFNLFLQIIEIFRQKKYCKERFTLFSHFIKFA